MRGCRRHRCARAGGFERGALVEAELGADDESFVQRVDPPALPVDLDAALPAAPPLADTEEHAVLNAEELLHVPTKLWRRSHAE
jgi:hypothetical protein